MKSLQQLVTRRAWLEAQLVKVSAEIKARTPKKKAPKKKAPKKNTETDGGGAQAGDAWNDHAPSSD